MLYHFQYSIVKKLCIFISESMMGRIAFHGKFRVTDEILDALAEMGKEVSVFASAPALGELLANEAGCIDCVLDINFHEEVREICVKYDKPYAAWSFDSGIRNVIKTTLKTELRKNDFLFLFNYTDYLDCSLVHRNTFYLPFSVADKYITPPRENDFAYDVLIIMSTYRQEVRNCEKSFRDTLANESDEVNKKTYEFLKSMMDHVVEKHEYIIDRNLMNDFIDEIISSCGFDPFNEKQRAVFCDQFGQILSSRQREICALELCRSGKKIDIFGDDDWREIIKDQASCTYHGRAPYEKLCSLYNTAKININLTQIQNIAGIPQRVMQLLAAGAFVLTNHNEFISMTFTPGIHLETFRTFEELNAKVDYYLKHEDARRKIAAAGQMEFINRHRMKDKLNTIFRELSGADRLN